MTGLTVVQSSMLGNAGFIPTSVPIAAASSFALAIFQRTKHANDNKNANNVHAPNRRRRNPDNNGGRSVLASRNPPKISASGTIEKKNSMIRLYHAWMRLPQIFRFFNAGNLGNLGFYYLEKVIFRVLTQLLVATTSANNNSFSVVLDGIEKYQDSLSFFSAYVIQIVTTHLLYAVLVYGLDTIDTYEKYSKTLLGQFKVYGVGLFGATFMNSFLIVNGGFDKFAAFWTTTATFAVFNYFLVSWVVKNAIESSKAKLS